MVGRKLLSLVSVLFAGSQLISMVQAIDEVCEISLVLGSESSEWTVSHCGDGFYRVTGAVDSNGQTFTNTNQNGAVTKIVKISGEGTTKEIDNTLDDGEYCVSSTDGEVFTKTADRFVNFCTNGCDTYIKCTNGVGCTSQLDLDCRTASSPTCDPTKNKETDSVNNEENCTNGGFYYVGTDSYSCAINSGKVECNKLTVTTPIGYFVNAYSTTSEETPYIQCTGTSCTALSTVDLASLTSCSKKKAGQLLSGSQLCRSDGEASPATLANGDIYLIAIEDGNDNIFAGKDGKSVILEVSTATVGTGLNIKAVVAGNGNYIVNSGNKLVSSDTDGTGSLIQCSGGEGSCESETTIGYFTNALAATHTNAPIISCKGDVCTAIKPPTVSDCTGKAPGDIIDKSGYKLCLSSTNKDLISDVLSSTNKYMVGATYNASGNPFQSVAVDNMYIVVDIASGDAVIHTQDKKKYRYTDANQKIYDAKNDAVCGNGSTIVEYSVDFCPDDNYDYYTQGTTKTWPAAQQGQP